MQGAAQWLDDLAIRWQHWDRQRPSVMTVLNCALLVALFVVVNRFVVGHLAYIPEANYYQDSIALASVQYLWQERRLWPPLAAAVFFIALRYRCVVASWNESDFPQSARLFISLTAFLLAWTFATYDYNLFLDRGHIVDRLLLLLAVPCIYWRPVFLLPFVCLLAPLIGQFNVPIGGYSWAQPYMPIRLLVLAVAALTLRCCIKRCWFTDFLLVALCLIATHYWIPGLGKFNLGWHHADQISLLLPTTYANGWLPFLDAGQLASLANFMALLDPALRLITLVLEWAVLFFLWRRSTAQLFLGCWVLFHCGVFFMSGIFFWKWIVIDIACIIWLSYLSKTQLANLFSTPRFCISIVLIASAAYWSKPTNLAWLDMPVTYTYRFSATTEDGKTYSLPPKFFAPYDYQFTLGNDFSYLSQHATLPIVWGGTSNTEVHRLVSAASTADQVLSIESGHGAVRYNTAKAAAFDRFLRQFVQAYNRRGSKNTVFSSIQAPRQLWTFPVSAALPEHSVITSIRIHEIVSYFDNHSYSEIATRFVRKVSVDG
ncbi:MAG: hypothetical protein ACR2P1_20905 [Pseudomonadales bacterium]